MTEETLEQFVRREMQEKLKEIEKDFPAHFMAKEHFIGSCNPNCFICELESE